MKVGNGERILVVDDDPLNRKLTTACLRKAGFDVAVAPTAEEALRIVRSEPPDAVLSDVRMVGMTGVELRDAIRSHPELARIPVILLSSSPEEYERRGLVCYPRSPGLDEAVAAVVAALRDGVART